MEEHMQSKTAPYIITVKDFEGPIDLMYQLIVERKMQINTISLASITEDYLKYIENGKLDSENIAYFIHTASILILIKSKSLLSMLEYTNEEDEDVRNLEELVQLYAFVQKRAVPSFDVWNKVSVQTKAPKKERKIEFAPDLSCSAEELYNQAQDVIKDISFLKENPKKIVQTTINIEEVIDRIMKEITSRSQFSFKEITNKKDRTEIILSFLAILELARKNLLQLKQNNMFEDIIVEKQKV